MAVATGKELISQGYHSKRRLYDALKGEVVFGIENALRQTDIKYHSINARVKELDSLLAKIDADDAGDKANAISDIVGVRIVTLFLSDINRIVDLLTKEFDVILTDNKIDDADPRLFGYFSVHVDARLKSTFSGPRYDEIKTITFEVQVRTIAMDAWAAASHYLDYKSDEDVPADLKRDFNALSGLFYVADKHFETLFRSRAAKLRRIDRAFKESKPPLREPLNLDNLTAFLNDRYPDRVHADSSHVSTLLSEVRTLGFNDLASLAAALDASQKAFDAEERPRLVSTAPNRLPAGKFSDVGVVRISLRPGHMDRKPAHLK
jgi:ppGpp synthetase/RelA/SpoT-type nucleotidyltranferase